MPADLKGVTEHALQLPPHDRLVLAESLLLTIDEDDCGLDEAAMADLERRFRELREGVVTGIPAEQAVNEIREALKRRA
jgi:putative addiction module component (TIGR02574 family)